MSSRVAPIAGVLLALVAATLAAQRPLSTQAAYALFQRRSASFRGECTSASCAVVRDRVRDGGSVVFYAIAMTEDEGYVVPAEASAEEGGGADGERVASSMARRLASEGGAEGFAHASSELETHGFVSTSPETPRSLSTFSETPGSVSSSPGTPRSPSSSLSSSLASALSSARRRAARGLLSLFALPAAPDDSRASARAFSHREEAPLGDAVASFASDPAVRRSLRAATRAVATFRFAPVARAPPPPPSALMSRPARAVAVPDSVRIASLHEADEDVSEEVFADWNTLLREDEAIFEPQGEERWELFGAGRAAGEHDGGEGAGGKGAGSVSAGVSAAGGLPTATAAPGSSAVNATGPGRFPPTSPNAQLRVSIARSSTAVASSTVSASGSASASSTTAASGSASASSAAAASGSASASSAATAASSAAGASSGASSARRSAVSGSSVSTAPLALAGPLRPEDEAYADAIAYLRDSLEGSLSEDSLAWVDTNVETLAKASRRFVAERAAFGDQTAVGALVGRLAQLAERRQDEERGGEGAGIGVGGSGAEETDSGAGGGAEETGSGAGGGAEETGSGAGGSGEQMEGEDWADADADPTADARFLSAVATARDARRGTRGRFRKLTAAVDASLPTPRAELLHARTEGASGRVVSTAAPSRVRPSAQTPDEEGERDGAQRDGAWTRERSEEEERSDEGRGDAGSSLSIDARTASLLHPPDATPIATDRLATSNEEEEEEEDDDEDAQLRVVDEALSLASFADPWSGDAGAERGGGEEPDPEAEAVGRSAGERGAGGASGGRAREETSADAVATR